MSQTKGGPTVKQLISETDHVQLSRLVTNTHGGPITVGLTQSTSYM